MHTQSPTTSHKAQSGHAGAWLRILGILGVFMLANIVFTGPLAAADCPRLVEYGLLTTDAASACVKVVSRCGEIIRMRAVSMSNCDQLPSIDPGASHGDGTLDGFAVLDSPRHQDACVYTEGGKLVEAPTELCDNIQTLDITIPGNRLKRITAGYDWIGKTCANIVLIPNRRIVSLNVQAVAPVHCGR